MVKEKNISNNSTKMDTPEISVKGKNAIKRNTRFSSVSNQRLLKTTNSKNQTVYQLSDPLTRADPIVNVNTKDILNKNDVQKRNSKKAAKQGNIIERNNLEKILEAIAESSKQSNKRFSL